MESRTQHRYEEPSKRPFPWRNLGRRNLFSAGTRVATRNHHPCNTLGKSPGSQFPGGAWLGGTSVGSYPPVSNPLAGTSSLLEHQYQELRELMYMIPGVARLLEKAARDSYADSPFVDDIALVGVPKGCVPPAMTLYDGTTDPLDHVNHYKQKMIVITATRSLKEACMCKGFGSTLSGAALQCQYLPPALPKKPQEKTNQRTDRIDRGPEEATRDFLNRFNREKVASPRCDIATAIEAFRQGLRQDSNLYKDLTKYPCTTFEKVQTKAIAVMRLEEDSGPRRAAYGTYSISRKAPVEKQSERAKPYSKPVKKVSEGPGGKNNSEPPPKVFRKRTDERPNDKRDSNKRCEYHDDIGHDTDECYTLREVKFQYDRGNLGHLLPGGSTKAHSANQVLPSPPPVCTRIVNVITGGSELYGLTYSAAKRHATQTKGDKPEFSCRISRQDLPAVTFNETDAQNTPEQHHDARIITLPIGNSEVRKILVDTGSSVNLIMLETLKGMEFSEKDLAKKEVPLVGFSGETKHSLGEIVIPTYAEGVNKQVRYLVVDGPSTYNVILGRPWIHEMKAIPSTYHQCLKFPTPWGVQEIRGD
ncbi:uncharacterized protein LOC141631704 [Silene latifolia]|uniref:uncharacterized protein LOC141631704 n=1 Tax=Silene latifolia TaxID=37657 RepID=UPI003D777757